jgi:cyclic pyranopterin phosphate synthase
MSDKVIPIRVAGAPSTPAAPGVAAQVPITGGAPRDLRGRMLRDLRISVTDRCNFRCVYCMPREVFDADYRFLPHSAILSFEEIARLARVFVGLGVQKLRLTGGEPLVRRDVDRLIAMLAALGVDIALTTNGSLLAKQAAALKAAGLRRVTVSLDSHDDATFRAMTDADFPVARVLEGIEAAAAAGLAPIKINMVVKRGVNDHQIVEAARRWHGSGHVLRFIEYMDVGSTNGWRMDDVVPSSEVVRRISEAFPLEPLEAGYAGEVAARWRYADGGGEIGVISSVTQAFCSGCTRMRLSTEGKLFTCLFADHGHDLMPLIRGGASDAVLRDAIAAVWLPRGDRYSEIRTEQTAQQRKVEMSYIGG